MSAPAVYRGDGNGREVMQGNDTKEAHDLSQSAKPEIDLASWDALGKPNRDRRQKKAWRRKQCGAIDAGLATWVVVLAVLFGLLVFQFSGSAQ